MILSKRAFRRLLVDIPWHTEVLDKSEFKLRFQEMHEQHLILMHKNFDDPFVAKFTTVWASREAFDNYRNDEILGKFWNARDVYNEATGITVEHASIEDLADDFSTINVFD
jgi:hypothetical protein